MTNAIIELVTQLIFALFTMLIGVLGTWLTIRLEQHVKLNNIEMATKTVIDMAQMTVNELQQTVVEGLKAANADNKLTKEEIAELGKMLIDMTTEKLTAPTYDLLKAAGTDLEALIKGAGEAWILDLKKEISVADIIVE